MGSAKQVVDVQLVNIEESILGSVVVNYMQTFRDGSKKFCCRNVQDLGGCYGFFSVKPIVSAGCLGKVYCGALRNDGRILFAVKLANGAAQLIQAREGTNESVKLLSLCGDIQPPTLQKPQSSSTPAQSYQLGKNELPQGRYLIGQDIPAGTYDFFVIYGSGGKFDIAKYDANGKVIDGTWNFFWVGLTENYEKRELIHVHCPEGYTIKISGNVILRIARSKAVRIDL